MHAPNFHVVSPPASLRRALGIAPAPRPGPTDCELVARAWARWGAACPERLLGEYAFALWDKRARTLFCARNAAGVQPFYWASTPRLLAFASTIDGVLAAPGVSDALDEAAVVTHLMRLDPHLPPPHTFFRAVRRLPPGHALTVEGATVRTVRWWRPEDAPAVRLGTGEEYAEAFRERYARAVADRVRGAGHVGVHLSGGLDSSSVAVLAARELRRRGRPAPSAFTWLYTRAVYKPAEGERLLRAMHPMIQEAVGRPIWPCNSFARLAFHDAELRAHTDSDRARLDGEHQHPA